MEEKNSNRGLVVGLIICIIIILLLTGLLVWKFIDKDSNNENTEVNTNEKQEETTSYDLTDAKKLIDKYASIYFGNNVFENGYDYSAKVKLAINNLSINHFSSVNCENLYVNNNEFKYDGNGYFSEKFKSACDENSKSISYDILNNKFKELFGKDAELEKSSIIDQQLDYDSNLNQFIRLTPRFGGALAGIHEYGIKTASKTGNILVIDVGYYTLEPDSNMTTYSTSLTDKKYTRDEIDKDTFNIEFFNEFKDKMDTYRFTFEYEVDHYVLKDMKKR